MKRNKHEHHQGVQKEGRLQPPPEAGEEPSATRQSKLMTRRKMLQVLGIQAVAGTVAVSAMAAPKNFRPDQYNRGITPDQLPNTRAWLSTNPAQCVGCRTCEIVCSLAHDGMCQPSLSRIHTEYDPTKTLAKLAVMADVCRQCNMADCYLACEYDALILDPDTGARIIDPNKCLGCGECLAACPWDMIVENGDTGLCTKCDLCGGDPQCVKYCPANAITYIELS